LHEEFVQRVECDACGGEMEARRVRKGDAQLPHVPSGCFLPVAWGKNKPPLNIRITAGPAEPGQLVRGPKERDPDICRLCLRLMFEFLADRLGKGEPVVGVAR
jgi:hypothetical protein